eukprot:9486434-Pyramimonas_sp.AAC.1
MGDGCQSQLIAPRDRALHCRDACVVVPDVMVREQVPEFLHVLASHTPQFPVRHLQTGGAGHGVELAVPACRAVQTHKAMFLQARG